MSANFEIDDNWTRSGAAQESGPIAGLRAHLHGGSHETSRPAAFVRVHRALCVNHRYRFDTWRWGPVTAALLLVGVTLKLATS